MKKKNIILSLTMALMIGIGTTAYAATSTSEAKTNFKQKPGFGMRISNAGHFKGKDTLTNLLKEKGVTEDEINSALEAGKSLYDFAIEKGLTDNEIKEYILNEKIKQIDEAVANGTMTSEQGTEAKAKLQENAANWSFQDKGTGKTKGLVNIKHNIHSALTNLLKEKGVTDEEINSALGAGKSLYDLAIEKGLTADEIKEYIVNEGIKQIDEAVTNGTMTSEQGAEAKTKLQEKSANWDFTNQGNGKAKGFMKIKHKEKTNADQQQNTTTSGQEV